MKNYDLGGNLCVRRILKHDVTFEIYRAHRIGGVGPTLYLKLEVSGS